MKVVWKTVHQNDGRFLTRILPGVDAVLTSLYKLFCEIHLPSEGMPHDSCLATAEIWPLLRQRSHNELKGGKSMITCDLCGETRDCLQKEIEGKEYSKNPLRRCRF